MTTLYLEDLYVGQRFIGKASISIDVSQVKQFAEAYDPQPFHMDEALASDTLFQGIAASGWHTAATTMRLLLSNEEQLAGGIIGAGFDDLRWPRPVRPGDALRVECEVLEVRRSRSKPRQGLVKLRTETFNQNDDVVQVMSGTLVVQCRSDADSLPLGTEGRSSWVSTPNKRVNIGSVSLAYRELGPAGGVPVVLLNHWGANLDGFDPRIVDALATQHHVIAIDYRGIGLSDGPSPVLVADFADDVIACVHALGHEQVDLFGFSLGGFVAQQIVAKKPELVRKLILAGTGPAGGDGIDKVGATSWPLIERAKREGKPPQYHLFFNDNGKGRAAAQAFVDRLAERHLDRDQVPSAEAFMHQLQAIEAWGRQAAQSLENVQQPVLIVNGDHDIMVPTELSLTMAERFPDARLIIYPDSGHGGIFQYHAEFIPAALAFLST
ncbi:alpha/beta fold hydrolase [Stenotrophomonas sp. PS02298]|uniref:alpha/beta fold hydrolase n=1 Tax=Stenotrophomonas sp. PS02298 TaxID=2991424 RepID=UPI00249AB4F8|nr:alpha/beta fold hydrolase [Stenotrophomonas sp. PS02298]